MEYRGKVLDVFQIEAVSYIDKNESIIVSAPTGTGKTLIADYAIEKLINEGNRVIYTAPVKALSNQKYREFSRLIGKEKVGILTGDVSINKEAPFLIMTTEVYRNILYSEKEFAEEIKCVIFDEIHYISDANRGTIWEECMLLKPKETFIIGLSATIPNIVDLAKWIEDVSGEKVNVVYHKERAVPLEHNYYLPYKGIIPIDKVSKILEEGYNKKSNESDYLYLFKNLNKDDFPLLFFSFNRRACLDKALTYSKQTMHQDEAKIREIDKVIENILEQFERNKEDINSYSVFVDLFHKGIGVHHAGLLPVIKMIVEELFEKRLLNVIFCTETFAIGINFPVKTVVIDGYRKYDGFDFRNLKNKEYFQIGGRAGRRGIDEFGKVITMVRTADMKYDNFPIWNEDNIELLNSNFKVSYNTTVHLFEENRDELPVILKDNFAIYLLNKQRKEFISSKNIFFEDIKTYREKTCDSLGKNQCYLHYNNVIKELEHKIKISKSKSNINNLKDDLKNFKKKKIKNCTSECKKKCSVYYDLYKESVEEYLKEKQMYEDFSLKYPEDYFIKRYQTKKNILNKMGYIDANSNNLLARGIILKEVYIQELLICELIYSDFLEKYDEETIIGALAGIDYDGKSSDDNLKPCEHIEEAIEEVFFLSESLKLMEINELGETEIKYNLMPCEIAYRVAIGQSLKTIIEEGKISDGDVVSIVRRTIAILSEIRDVVEDRPTIHEKIRNCIRKIDRDEYKALY